MIRDIARNPYGQPYWIRRIEDFNGNCPESLINLCRQHLVILGIRRNEDALKLVLRTPFLQINILVLNESTFASTLRKQVVQMLLVSS